ncbi:MAG: cobalamin biosynthesis protein CbiX [Aeromicrobium sp.]|uniref:Sirohydrochlorin ferrochelatase n=1 Tax=uncultured bacterium A1Q1_fos_1060 TaxID=1256540 RepID=L7VSX2_9BACT|nr:sirohydrochlorin ferrochelatase [uncultured bacterium A1Q1_fos_1060]TXJ07292.1 MAG: cobalamin biosynthesis protein CbiX [Aeromicrobium sp.]
MEPNLVLCSHGTADQRGQEVIRRFANTLQNRLDGARVIRAVVDVEAHQLDEVLSQNPEPSVVVPLLLSSGYHVNHDIATIAARHLHVTVAKPLGPSISLARQAAHQLLERGLTRNDHVVFAASGSSQERAMHDVAQAALYLSNVLGTSVHLGHLGGHGRNLHDVVRSLQALESGNVFVSTYLLAPGHFYDQVLRCESDFVTEPLLTASAPAGLLDLVLARYQACLSAGQEAA